jgi:hypothetical protein
MRTLPYLMLAVLCWFTSSLLVEINRVPRFGADYLVGLAFDLLLVVAACVFCALLWTKSQRARTFPTPIKALIAFAVPFVASLPIVVAQKAQFEKPIYIRRWDFYRAMYLRESDWWIVIAIHLFVSLLFAAALLFAIRRLEHLRPEAAHRGVPVGGPSRRIETLLLCVNFSLAWQYYLALAPGRPNYSLTHELAMGASIETFKLVDTD